MVRNSLKRKIGDYDVYHRNTQRGWAISILPPKIRIDNYHGYPHIQFSLHGIKHKININIVE
ncbi:MAG: hypothetical protein LBT10_03045 [Methanobrevibacter sp.]|jgi:hypothetical protein|nr:hypothetical protein [Methanobrevibacter sp.]